MEFRILGPVEARRGGRTISLGGAKPKSVLAALILADGRALSIGEIREALWDGPPPKTMAAQIHTYVSRLRKVLGPGVELSREAGGYALRVDGAAVDYREFVHLAELGSRALADRRHRQASAHLSAALGKWCGQALAGVAEPLADAEAPRLHEMLMTAYEEKAEADLALGRHREVVAELSRLIERHPLRERPRALLMIALYRAGRQADALETYYAGRKVLADELGVDPSGTLEDVFHAILNGDPSLDLPGPPAEPIVGGGPPSVPAILPPDIADFAGREDRLDPSALRRARLPPRAPPGPLGPWPLGPLGSWVTGSRRERRQGCRRVTVQPSPARS